MHTDVHCSPIHNSQDAETTCLLTDEYIRKPWYIHTMKYYSARKRRKFSFATTWMNFKGKMLREISPKKTNNLRFHLHVESTNTEGIEIRVAFVAARSGQVRETGEGGQRNNYKMNKFWECRKYGMVTIVNNTVSYTHKLLGE